MPTITVSSGVTSTGLVIPGGTVLDVLAGGTVVNTTLLSGGVESVTANAFDSVTTVSSGGTLIAEQIGALSLGANELGDTVLSGGAEIAYRRGGGRRRHHGAVDRRRQHHHAQQRRRPDRLLGCRGRCNDRRQRRCRARARARIPRPTC